MQCKRERLTLVVWGHRGQYILGCRTSSAIGEGLYTRKSDPASRVISLARSTVNSVVHNFLAVISLSITYISAWPIAAVEVALAMLTRFLLPIGETPPDFFRGGHHFPIYVNHFCHPLSAVLKLL